MGLNLNLTEAVSLWTAIREHLDRSLPAWKSNIERFGQVAAVEARRTGRRSSDDEVFEALLRAVLSSNTDWARVERVLPDLKRACFGFSLEKYADTTPEDIEHRLVPWFKEQKAGSMSLRKGLLGLHETAGILLKWSHTHGSAEHYFLDVLGCSVDDPKLVAVALCKIVSVKKLPSLGIPIAAESLRNLGFDVCKPDRHLCRAAGSFRLVQFRSWPDHTGTKAPATSPTEMLMVMTIIERIARLVGVRPTFLDTAIWLLCSKQPMGLHLSNDELASMAIGSGSTSEQATA